MNAPAVRPASIARHYESRPQIDADGVKTWISRGTNFVCCISDVQAGATLRRSESQQPDEYMVFLVDTTATFKSGDQTLVGEPETLVVVPPGDSEFTVSKDGRVVSFFSDRAADLAAIAQNAGEFASRSDAVAPLVPWPTPADGFKLRAYPVGQFTKSDSNMRIFRSTNLMVNVMLPRMVPRDVSKLSPHAHADFEQGSLALKGDWVHHIRYPWGPDMNAWRDDEHLQAGSPSMTIIPPKSVHTSRNTNEGGSWLFDVFAPPRMDFSMKPGMVANADDYPMPAAP